MISSVVLFSLVVFVDSVSGQQFESGTKFYRRQFTNITIPWIFTYNGDGSFITTWKYMGTSPEIVIYRLTDKGLPLNDPIPRNQFSGRVNFIGDVIRNGSKDATLSIKDFTKQDEGDFECSIQGAVSIAHKVTIVAIVLSNVTNFRVINVAKNDVVQGTEVTLSCTATVGKPSSNIELLKGTNVLNSSMTSATSSMTVFYNFKNITKKDSGEYICEVKTTNGYVSRKVLQLSVKFLSNVTDFRVINVAQNVVVQGTEVTLSCTATVGKPSSNIELLKGTNVLNSSMTSATSSMTVFYNFKNITKEDSGEYICEVKTTNGYVSRKVLQLSVKFLSNVTDFRVINVAKNNVVQGTEVTLSCTATVGKPSSNIELLKGTNVLNSSMTSATSSMTVFYNFKNITKKDSGEYICEVKTTNGYVSRKVLQLSVKYKPGEPVFSQCAFDKLTWLPSISKTSVKYTLQAKEVSGIWFDILTSSDTMYSPSTNETLSNSKDYEFRVVASNCVGSTESKICSVTGQKTPGKRSGDSSNTGVIVGSVIGALAVIIVILILLICWKKRQQRKDSSNVRVKLSPTKNNPSNVKNEGGVVYRDTPDMNTPQVPPPAQYQRDDNDDHYENDYNQKSTNIPSWV
ncbi:contactin-2-like isoform X1 [Xenia sp. Carnegie-2017]|uniref:contactin-2-like isoform X1 n=1 Tax=Xenia sp. Carnegie-2017 TaxID=2897299 RepID=UPI001F049AED|nr:contactin-2-like isoform X1 [Xenia sp. Carnegie-2017]